MSNAHEAHWGEGFLEEAWGRILDKIRPQLNPRSFDTWLIPAKPIALEGDCLRLAVPNELFAEWLGSTYMEPIVQAARACELPVARLEFVPPGPGQGSSAEPEPPKAPPAGDAATDAIGLNPRYSFDSFVVSSCNQFAHAACMSVAEKPSQSYNPLYIYGGVGLGKTHLMQAIGQHLAENRPELRIRYLSTETFMNDLISSIRHETTYEFKDRYRNVDVLLVDDIQFIAGKESTQEEFFHTFNALYDSQKQIVITSDCPPRNIPTIEERLRSRFEWGLIADIQQPDLETKIAILNRKAESEGHEDIPSDVALFIASKSKSNIRELEGALIRVLAYASTTGRPMNLDLAKETLRDLLREESSPITIETIQKHVADYYNLKVAELKTRTNSMRIAFPRQVAMYLCKQLTSASLPEIGRRFGGKHHSTVIHGVQKITEKRKTDRDFDRLVEGLAESFQ